MQTLVGALCVADIDGSRVVDGNDLGSLLSNWGDGGGAGDFDRNGIVDGFDLGSLLAGWGPCQ
ncbi:MAG: hypothetical protein DWH71_04525 [Planctomycetota bacterium]|nr:MAG: hypothetical protein DWH71_04525 [Planctomycetota bacterium]